MTGTLIATTQKASVHALAFQGIMVYSGFPQIRDMLLRKFGDEYVLLFARPVENTQTSEIDWYSPVYGSAQKLDSLPPDKQDAAREKALTMARDIREYAEELMRSPDPLKVTRGNILRLALSYPDENYIYVIGEQPVLVCWGFGPGTPGVQPMDLTRLAATPKTASPPPPPEEPAKAAAAPTVTPVPGRRLSWGWLWWLLPLALACLLFMFLFTSFGPIPPLAGTTLFHGPELAFLKGPARRSAEIGALEREIGELEARLEKHAAMCVQTPKATIAPPAPEPALTQIPDRLTPEERDSAKEGLVIPEKTDDTAFLKGEWLCDTGLVNMRTREHVEVLFAFGENGQGHAIIYEKNDKCSGAARAVMRNGELFISVDDQRCTKSGDSYNNMNIICRNAAGASAECIGENPGGNTWKADFRKIK